MFQDPLLLADVSDDSDVHGVPNILSVPASLFAPSGEPKSEPNTAQSNLHVSTNLPSLTWPLIFRLVGAHCLEEDWTCLQCQPWWHNWYCEHCCLSVPPAWTCQNHFGECGQSCVCCRFEFGEAVGYCEACQTLWVLKATCCEVRLALLSYDGR